jgi:hypothetical protein
MYNNGNSSKNVTGASVVDGTLENADYADNAISGDKIDGGTISGSVTLVTPDIGTPSAGTLTNCSGTASSLTSGNVTTNANLTGVVTSSGNATAIADNAISGDKIDGGIISNFQSTGIDDRLASGKSIYTNGTKVGIGTSTPSYKLSVYGANVELGNGYTDGVLTLGSFSGSNSETVIKSGSDIKFTTFQTAAFYERMRIDSSGNVLVGTTVSGGSNPAKLEVASTGGARIIQTKSGVDTSTNAITFNTPSGQAGLIYTNTLTTTYATSSDYRLKENVVPMTGSIDRLKNLKPSRFNFSANPTTTVDGFLAHEAQEVVPEAINGTKDAMTDMGNITDAEGVITEENVVEPVELQEGQAWTKTGEVADYQGIDQSKLVPLLVAALQEAIARIETLENA